MKTYTVIKNKSILRDNANMTEVYGLLPAGCKISGGQLNDKDTNETINRVMYRAPNQDEYEVFEN